MVLVLVQMEPLRSNRVGARRRQERLSSNWDLNKRPELQELLSENQRTFYLLLLSLRSIRVLPLILI